jgi:hypothetical protein
MKKLSFYSGSLLFVIGFTLISYSSKAQDVKLSKQEKKDLEQAALYANYNAMDTLIGRKTFVIEADYLQDLTGNRVFVNSVLNYILVDSLKAVLQTGSNSRSGYNGVGGVTAQGNIQNYKVVKDPKKLTYNVSFTVMTNVGIYDVTMDISANTNASATISGLSRGRLTWYGRFQNLYRSNVYKGQETF